MSADTFTIFIAPIPEHCCLCGETEPESIVVRWTFPNERYRDRYFCHRDCAARIYPELTATLPIAAWEIERDARLEAEAAEIRREIDERDQAARDAALPWHPDPHRDERRREFDAMTQESRRYNERW